MSTPEFSNPIIRWIDYRLPIFTLMQHEMHEYPTPKNLSYWWNFGSLAGIMLVVMMATGIVLAMHFTAHATMAFDSVERIMRDVNYGWLIRYLHMNGGSAFFFVVYVHIFRGLYYGSYKAPRELLWMLGLVILLLMMMSAFTGYVLPWGQMSFWAATVITNLFSAVPWIGEVIVTWLWGGFSVDNALLTRFFSLHYLMPFVIVGAVVLHLAALHQHGSGNPVGIDTKGPQDSIPFHPYYTIKDLYGAGLFFMLYMWFVFFAPNALGEVINYIPADPLQTPPHIVPEWYFLPYYAILRAIPDNFIGNWIGFVFISAKLAGVIAMYASILILFVLPWLDTSKVRSGRFRPVFKYFFWILFVDTVILGIVGGNAPNDLVFSWAPNFEYLQLGQITTAYYFFHFIILLPALGLLERPRPLPHSISEPVLKGGGLAGAAATAKPMEKV